MLTHQWLSTAGPWAKSGLPNRIEWIRFLCFKTITIDHRPIDPSNVSAQNLKKIWPWYFPCIPILYCSLQLQLHTFSSSFHHHTVPYMLPLHYIPNEKLSSSVLFCKYFSSPFANYRHGVFFRLYFSCKNCNKCRHLSLSLSLTYSFISLVIFTLHIGQVNVPHRESTEPIFFQSTLQSSILYKLQNNRLITSPLNNSVDLLHTFIAKTVWNVRPSVLSSEECAGSILGCDLRLHKHVRFTAVV